MHVAGLSSRVAQTATNGRVRAEKPLPLPSSSSISLFDDRIAKVSRLTQTRLSRRLPTRARVTIAIVRMVYRTRGTSIFRSRIMLIACRRARARERELTGDFSTQISEILDSGGSRGRLSLMRRGVSADLMGDYLFGSYPRI